jgi:hypothetical protein
MNGRKAKQLRKDNQIIVILDKDTGEWLQGFFTILLAPLKMDDLSSDCINARQTLRAVQEGLKDETGTDTDPATE